jgi:hypothetical protein
MIDSYDDLMEQLDEWNDFGWEDWDACFEGYIERLDDEKHKIVEAVFNE